VSVEQSSRGGILPAWLEKGRMNIFLIGCLVAAILFVGHGFLTSRAENSQLKIHVAALKRQLAKRDH
jgi:hypothetical protein